MYKIYKIANLLNGKCYIGLTKQTIQHRFNEHVSAKIKHVSAVKDAIKKYGKENFTIEELTTCKTLDEAYSVERLGIRYFNTLSPFGYNLHTGGTGGKLTDEIKQKISKKTKERMSVKENNPMYGKSHSEETLRKISESKTGKLLSDEHKQKISDSTKGEKSYWYGKKSDEMPWGNNGGWNKGIPMKEEAKQKRTISCFYKAINEIFSMGMDTNVFHQNEVKYMENKLSEGRIDIIVGFFIGKVQDVKWGCKDKTRDEKDKLIQLNRKMKTLYHTHDKIKELLTGVTIA